MSRGVAILADHEVHERECDREDARALEVIHLIVREVRYALLPERVHGGEPLRDRRAPFLRGGDATRDARLHAVESNRGGSRASATRRSRVRKR